MQVQKQTTTSWTEAEMMRLENIRATLDDALVQESRLDVDFHRGRVSALKLAVDLLGEEINSLSQDVFGGEV